MVFVGDPFSGSTSAPEMLPMAVDEHGRWLRRTPARAACAARPSSTAMTAVTVGAERLANEVAASHLPLVPEESAHSFAQRDNMAAKGQVRPSRLGAVGRDDEAVLVWDR
ncbi:hypothetical protein [Streptomyces olivochromogenes]|uniref:hypothetical protein n=1 Tax=Streptomyces olivochromogenes TaxID=1963 RepID=UPI001F440979|nr:hypothetical protein [Streptomyces olivochromogenes]MCF3132685.1 hypothetical protein [Streptomyces olivochromogenes]